MAANIEYLRQQVEIKRAEYELARLNLENASKSPLLQLPEDVFGAILGQISLQELWKLRKVSKRFHQAYWKTLRERYQQAIDKLTYGTRFTASDYGWKTNCVVVKKVQQKNGLFLHFRHIGTKNGNETIGEEVRKGKLKMDKQYRLMCSYMSIGNL